ncbi:MAG: arginine--tRNA ligase [Prevotellaceae bacterium]|jgi:arginyl-tRNA synthetase|nr:arginine--tRNA ligase [Prevotellaceae bacterium]
MEKVSDIEYILAGKVAEAVQALYGQQAAEAALQVQTTRKEYEGDFTVVMFPLLKISRLSPEKTGEAIGAWLQEHCPEAASVNVVKGFLNIKLTTAFWHKKLQTIAETPQYGIHKSSGKTVMVEYSSPNTNKPLHLGHIRNNLLGYSVAKLLEANGHKVIKVNLVNDRGIHICKSMLAWKHWGGGETPENTGIKGDHLVGKYYVRFNDEYLKQQHELIESKQLSKDAAAKQAPIIAEAQEMLRKWEQGDKEVTDLWRTMNSWVYAGFDETYNRLGVSFDKIYYESNTYLLGKKMVDEGLRQGVFTKRGDGSVWIDLAADGLDQKLLLRSDGTSVYMTQDLGTAVQRHAEYPFDELIYVVGNEQNYHFQVLKLILKKSGYAWADAIYHLSYGMVELPEGKMKSREGTVVDADDLIDEMVDTARKTSQELGKLDNMPPDEQARLFETLGLGALKYFILKVDPAKTMLFNPKDSIDFNGNTGPFIQYTHARIKSVLRKAAEQGLQAAATAALPDEREAALIKRMSNFPAVIREAAEARSPALVANYTYELAKEFNQYYHDVSILREPDEAAKTQRLLLLQQIAGIIKTGMEILGIVVPERM